MSQKKLYHLYTPYRDQQGNEIPAFEICEEDGKKLADTNEQLSIEQQEYTAFLFSQAPTLLQTLKDILPLAKQFAGSAHPQNQKQLKQAEKFIDRIENLAPPSEP